MPKISDRRLVLRDVSKDLASTENKLDQAGKKEAAKALKDIKDAGKELGNAADNLAENMDVVVEGTLQDDGIRGYKVITRCASKYEPKRTAMDQVVDQPIRMRSLYSPLHPVAAVNR